MTTFNPPETLCAVAALIQINDSVRVLNPNENLDPALDSKTHEEGLSKRPDGLALCGAYKYWGRNGDGVFVEPTEDDVPEPSVFEDDVLEYMGDAVRLFEKEELAAVEFLVVSFPLLKIRNMTYRDFEKIAALARSERSRVPDPHDFYDRHFGDSRFSKLHHAIEDLGGRLDYGLVSVREFLIKAA